MTHDYRWMKLHDGELDSAEESELRTWAVQDPGARSELDGFRRIGDLVREVHAGERDPALTELILARVRSSAAARPRAGVAGRRLSSWVGRSPAAVVAVVAAVAVAASLAIVLGSQPTGPEPRRLITAPLKSVEPSVIAQSSSEHPAGVSIQSVDFGSTRGAIFMVSEGGIETPVVWTLEDAKDKG